MAGRSAVSASSKWLDGFRKWYYNAAGFNKLGLMRDDTLHETEDVKEAIRRLPEDLYNDRMFRIKRALDLTMRHQILPKDQWTKYEEDKFYLEPYLKEVIRERKEREEWGYQSVFIENLRPAHGECFNTDEDIGISPVQ